MTGFTGSPRLIRAGIVLVEPDSGVVLRTIVLQYNPDTLTRTLQPKSVQPERSDRSEALRLTGPPVETIKFDAEIDAADQLEFPDQNRDVTQVGLYPQLSALESLVYPASAQLLVNNAQAQAGTLEIAPMEAPLALLVWSKNRIIPVRVSDFSITEEAFDPALNPIRAKVSLGLRVLSVDDLGFQHRGGALYMAYQQQKERLAALSRSAGFGALGIQGLPS